MQPQKKPLQFKICQNCNKAFPTLWKTLTIGGKRLKVCQICSTKLEKKKIKEKKEKQKVKRKEKRERITERKLDTVFSQLVRNIYPSFCHSSKVPVTVPTSQCAHLVSRKCRCLRWDLRNCYPTTPQENLFNQLHVIQLAKRLKEYYNIDIDDWEQGSKQNICKITDFEKQQMYIVFKESLEKVYQIKLKSDQSTVESNLEVLRLEIIKETKKIF